MGEPKHCACTILDWFMNRKVETALDMVCIIKLLPQVLSTCPRHVFALATTPLMLSIEEAVVFED